MTPAEILRAAADLLEQPGCWTQGALAINSGGDIVGAKSPHAVCWCAAGAIRSLASGGDAGDAMFALADGLLPLSGDAEKAIMRFNDTPGRTAAEVAAKMREAAQKLEGAA